MPRLTVWMVRAALLTLGTGFLFGGLLLANKGIPFAPEIWRLLPIHVDLLIFGWMMQLAIGVAYWILPRFTNPPRYGRTWLAQAAFGLLNAGLLLSVLGEWVAQAGVLLLGRVLLAASVLSFAVYIAPRIKSIPVPITKKGHS